MNTRVDCLLLDSFLRKQWYNQGSCAIGRVLSCNVLAKWLGQLRLF